jgi:Xaa-Pro dipeptidase
MTIGIGGSTAEAELAAITSMRDAVPPIGAEEIARRVAAARVLMEDQGVEAMWLDGTTNLAYFTGLRHGQSERMVGAILPRRGEITFICPAFEAERIRAMQPIPAPVRGWEEDEDPFALFYDTLRSLQITSGGIAIDDLAHAFIAHGIREGGGADYRYGRSASIASFLRQRKTGHEIALITQAMRTTVEIHKAAARILHEGIATTAVQAFIDAAHRKAGFDGGCPFNIVLFGEASAYPHGVPYPQTLKSGDMVLIDCGASLHNYRSDITRSYVFGEPTERQRFLWNTVKQSQAAGFAAARPGVPCGALDDAARGVIVAAGFGPGYATPGLPHRVGHGVGMDGHEEPYFVKGNALPLDVGMCGSIEPTLAVYGECGIRLEDHIHVTEKGAAWFTMPAHSVDDPFGVEARR